MRVIKSVIFFSVVLRVEQLPKCTILPFKMCIRDRFKVMIRLEKLAKSTNEAPVCLRITKDRKTMYKTLLHIDPKYWDVKGQCVKKQHPNAELLNATIARKKARDVYKRQDELEVG